MIAKITHIAHPCTHAYAHFTPIHTHYTHTHITHYLIWEWEQT